MRFIIAALVAAPFVMGPPAGAQVLDLSTVKCKEFVSSNKETIGIILAWLNAYYKGEDDPAVIDFAQLGKDAERLGAHCATNPELGLITAADSLFDK